MTEEKPPVSASTSEEEKEVKKGEEAEKEEKEEDEEERGFLEKMSDAVHHGLHWTFTSLARLVVNYPKSTMAAVLLLSAALFLGFLRFEEEKDGRKLFAPRDSRAVEEDDWVADVFGYSSLNTRIYFVAAEGKSMLTAAGVKMMMDFHERMINVRAESGGVMQTYAMVCERASKRPELGKPCPEEVPRSEATVEDCEAGRGPLSLWGYNATKVAALTDKDVIDAVNDRRLWRKNVPTGAPIELYLSEVGLQKDTAGRIIGARAVRMNLPLKNERGDKFGGRRNDDESYEWQLELVEMLKAYQPGAEQKGVTVEVQTDAEEDKAGDDAVDQDLFSLVTGYMIMIVFACFILSRTRVKYSHSLLGLISVLAVGLSTLSAYGLCWYIGLKFNTVTQVLILVLLGIGIDDTFVIMDSWWDNAHIPDMKERMILAMAHAGPAITITSLTDLAAFLAGSSTEIPALQVFCYYACLGIFFTFLYQATFFVAAAYLDSVRQADDRRDVLVCMKTTDEAGWVGSCCVPKDENGEVEAYDESDRGNLQSFIGGVVPRYVLGTVIGKVLVLLVAAAVLGMGIWGLTEVKMNYNNEWFVPDGHRFRDVMALRDEYFGGRSLPAEVYVRKVNYPAEQRKLELMLRDLEASRWVVKGSTASWLRAFRGWVVETSPQDIEEADGVGVVREAQFYPLLKRWISTEGPNSARDQLSNLHWSGCSVEADTVVVASRMDFTIIEGPLADGQMAIDCMDGLREVLDPYGTFPHSIVFVFWESYKVFFPEVIKNVSIAGACVLVLVTLLTANLWIGLFVIVALACVDVCMMGYMPWMGVELNGVSVICVVLAIGLAVDYSVHIAKAFITVTAEDTEEYSARTQRAAYALWKMGPAVLNGGFSTFLAVAPLIFAVSYAFIVFFRMFFLIIAFGLLFGVFVLPVVLSMFGPSANRTAQPLQPHQNPLHPDFHAPIPKKGVRETDPDVEMQA